MSGESSPSQLSALMKLQGVPCLTFADPSRVITSRHTMIAEAAYFKAEQRGFAPGQELRDWLAAEREIDARLLRR